MTTTADIQTHIENLGSRDQSSREAAIERLVEIGESAVGSLIILTYEPIPTTGEVALSNQAKRRLQAAVEVIRRIGKPAVGALIHAVSGPNAEARYLLLPLLIEIGPEEAKDTIRKLLQAELWTAQSLRKQRLLRRLMMLIFILLIWFFGYMDKVTSIFLHIVFWGLFGLLAAGDVAIGIRKRSLSALAKTERTEWAGLYALYLADADKDMRNMAADLLINLLPRLRADDKAQFGDQAMEILIKAINKKKPALTLSILKALEQIGDECALPRVEALASELAEAKNGQTRELYEAAQSCLPFLRQRAEQSRQAHTLLRASSLSESTPTELLLRPAEGGNGSNVEELLRPTHQSV